jgi:hypothetical protein
VICVLRRDKRLGCDENVHGGLEAMLARPGSPQGVHHLAALVTAQSGEWNPLSWEHRGASFVFQLPIGHGIAPALRGESAAARAGGGR